MSTAIRIIEEWTRNLGIPDVWIEAAKLDEVELYNAARPFPAHQTAQGEFVHGVFYGLIDPAQDYADEHRKRAIELDASRLVFVTRQEVEDWGRAYCKKYNVIYEDYNFSDIAKSYLQHSRREDAL